VYALFAIDRNRMRMYVVFVVVVLLIAGLLFLVDRGLKAVERGRRRRAAGARLAAAAAYAEQEDRQRQAAADASAALTSVLPAIQEPERGPRRVA
jgi:hypothetical protein